MEYKRLSRKGASLSGLSEAVIGVILLLLCLGIIVVGMNQEYNKSYNSTFGISSLSSAKGNLNDYQGTVETGLGAEATENSLSGVNVIQSYSIIKNGISTIISVLTGQFIQNLVGLIQLGESGIYLGWALRLLFVFALGFVLIKLLFKVKA